MSRNGSGVYSLPPGLPANGDVSNATDDILTPFADLETDMNTPRPIVAGGTGAASAAAARTALGLAIGTDVQAYDAGLASIAGLTTAANKMIYTTASDVYAATDLTAAGRAILDDANAAAQLTTLGVSAFAQTILDDTTAGAALTTLGVSAFSQTLLDDTTALAFLTTLGFGVAGSAPFYLPRAWVNFDGTGTPAIRSSGNVTSITDNGVGDYTINFTTAMADANYAYSISTGVISLANLIDYTPKMTNMTTTSISILTLSNNVAADFSTVSVTIFR